MIEMSDLRRVKCRHTMILPLVQISLKMEEYKRRKNTQKYVPPIRKVLKKVRKALKMEIKTPFSRKRSLERIRRTLKLQRLIK
jgi:protein associated with RNAse G/E